MKSDIRKRARGRLDERLHALQPIDRFKAPPGAGWVRALRDALGMTRSWARALESGHKTVESIEKPETAGTIQLNTPAPRRRGTGLHARLRYALVPNSSLEAVIEARARKIATRELQSRTQCVWKPRAPEMRISNLASRHTSATGSLNAISGTKYDRSFPGT